ncbi:uncharacterized protein [Clytia hemisphaerica]|uniref:uncharacterized protein n=1 Tax=Clytia hemisphaerica TaxID=252671 RepID=UPI0034D76D78
MSDRPRRSKANIRYDIYGTTGKKVIKPTSPEVTHPLAEEAYHPPMEEEAIKPRADGIMVETELKKLLIEESTFRDEITDAIQENSTDIVKNSLRLINSSTEKIKELRLQYRSIHKTIAALMDPKEYQTNYQPFYTDITHQVVVYLQQLNILTEAHHSAEVNAATQISTNQACLLIDEIDRTITYLNASCTCIATLLSNEELKQRKSHIEEQSKELKEIPSKLRELLGLRPDMEKYNSLKTKYEALIKSRAAYHVKINDEVKLREFDKLESFKKSRLNIKLPQFTGYDSKIDIYTFIDEFDKLHSDSVPKSLQPEFLKNNYLDKQALAIVKSLDNIKDIWDRLKQIFGDKEVLLQHKLHELMELTKNPKLLKDSIKIIDSLSKITNTMRDLMQLAAKHNIENELFYSNAFSQIVSNLGDSRMMRWLQLSCQSPETGKRKWKQMIDFLETEMAVHQQKAAIQIASNQAPKQPSKKQPSSFGNHSNTGGQSNGQSGQQSNGQSGGQSTGQSGQQSNGHPGYQSNGQSGGQSGGQANGQSITECFVCGATDHVQTNGPNGTKLVQYFACKKFVDMSPADRFQFLLTNGFCFQCLYPGANVNQGKHRDGKCQHQFACKNSSHNRFPRTKHVLVCDEHKNDQHNKDVLEHYKARCILKQPLPTYSKNISIFHSIFKSQLIKPSPTDDQHDAIFILQPIRIENSNFTIFYDNGCSDFISRYQSVQRLGPSRAKQVYDGTIHMKGIAGISSPTNHGIYEVNLPLRIGGNALMTGPCLDRVTNTFPMYPLNGEVFNDIKTAFITNGGNASTLPTVPEKVGGDVDFIIGIKYLRHFPKPIFQMLSGLTIYESSFESNDGSFGLIGGPHQVFNFIHQNQSTNFVTNQLRLYSFGYHVNPDVRLLGYNNHFGDVQDDTTNPMHLFNSVEEAGSSITYRCTKCRDCSTCKESPNDICSIKEEAEQEIINNSVTVNIKERSSTATLPLIASTDRLQPNRGIALQVFNQQLKRLEKNPDDKADIIKSEEKLQSLGYVDYVKNLSQADQDLLHQSNIQNFIPWRAVWKENSVSTPCRVVFDASMPTKSGFSLNDIIAKGRNNMNKLLNIFLRWRGYRFGFHTDVQKMYNSVKLDKSHWVLQRYLWNETLDSTKPPEQKVIKTLIYGVKSSGNQAERCLRETAKQFQNDHPDIYRIVSEDVYVDDCLSGDQTLPKVINTADRLETVVNNGGFTLKGFTFSCQDPIKKLSKDSHSVSVAGLKWYPKEDTLSIDVQDLNFAKKYRGRKPTSISDIPTNLTRRQCSSKLGELYDISGIVTPFIATMKMDMHQIVKHKFEWDDTLPDNLRNMWVSHFEMMKEIKTIKYKRAIVPEEAVNLNIETLDFGDASEYLACSAIYVRFKLKDETYSCQLIFARSQVLEETTQPRGELLAALLNSHTGQTVKSAFGDRHKSSIKFTDSQIALYWICNPNLDLMKWTRNRVIQILRFTDRSQWFYVKSEDMIADIGTRRCSSVDTINKESDWINGYSWMKLPSTLFPSLSKDKIQLSAQERQLAYKECKPEAKSFFSSSIIIADEVAKRYKLSNYLVDPNARKFSSIVRILVIIRKFIKTHLKISSLRPKRLQTKIQEDDLEEARNYLFRKATLEVNTFVPTNKVKKISEMKDGILYYTGRILPTDNVTILGNATNVMKDLGALHFHVPIIDRHSPLAYAIVNDIHWNHPTASHTGVETTWRYILQVAYIIEGRYLVKQIRSLCAKCRFLMKQQLDVSMGPTSLDSLNIAPAFYCSQTDLAGPFLSYSNHHKRTTVKIWLIVFCCATTTAVKIKLMEDYTTTSFVQAFTRLACEVGYPKKLLVDEGSQLLKGCKSMQLNFQDIKAKIEAKSSIEFSTCPVGGHNFHGRVERKIREIRKSLEKSVHLERLSMMQWETLAASISNSINNLPLAIKNKGDFEFADLITPNRLILGRNNDRCPTEPLSISDDSDKIIRSNGKIFNAWFECWLTSHVPSLMHQPKWFNTDRDLQPGDVVLFTKQDSAIASTYQYGRIKSVNRGRDNAIRDVVVEYQNSNENTKRLTTRAVRTLILILGADEIDLSKELFKLK